MTQEKLLEVARKYCLQFDPQLIVAICFQESGYDETEVRLENGYYRQYVRKKQTIATTSEVLLSASYGLMQTMGLSLSEAGYFAWFSQNKGGSLLPMSQLNIVRGIDEYMIHSEWQVQYGTLYLKKKLDLAGGDIRKALGYWNGDQTGKYAADVMTHYDNLKKGVVLK